MIFFKDGVIPSCSDCEYANLYIPIFSYPHTDPFCSKGHGQCKVDKLCEDFRFINSHFCYECNYCENGYCHKNHVRIDENKQSCVYFSCRSEFLK